MDVLGTGLILLINGLLTILGGLASWVTLCGIISAVGLLYLSRVEIRELDRSNFKPEVERH